MRIEFRRVGTTVVASCLTGIKNDQRKEIYYELIFDPGDDAFAELLAVHLRNRHYDAMKAIREQAYNRGWKDAKAKKTAKLTEFTSYDDVDPNLVGCCGLSGWLT